MCEGRLYPHPREPLCGKCTEIKAIIDTTTYGAFYEFNKSLRELGQAIRQELRVYKIFIAMLAGLIAGKIVWYLKECRRVFMEAYEKR